MPRLPALSSLLAAWLLATPAAAGYDAAVAAYGRGTHDVAAREFLDEINRGGPMAAESMYMLGRLYAMGSGVPQDWVRAWVWQDRAARTGHDEARKARESLEEIMTPQQMSAARGAAAPPPPSPPMAGLAPLPQPPFPMATARPPENGERMVVLQPRRAPPAGMAAAPSRDAAATERLLARSGGLGEQLRLVQRELNRAGFFAGPVDGRMGPLTRQAIRAYERDQGLAVTGRLSVALVDRLAAGLPATVVAVEQLPSGQQARSP